MENQKTMFESIEELRLLYEKQSSTEANSKTAIDAYHKWYNAAIVYFSQHIDENNADYKTFKNVDNSGNGYSLRSNYHQISGIYHVLLNKICHSQLNNKTLQKHMNTKVFIVHGHDDAMKLAVESLVEEPSDFKEIVYIPFDVQKGWRIQLAKELKAVGYSIDLNKII